MCWGERTENRCPIDHSIDIRVCWFGCQYNNPTPCHDTFLVPVHTNKSCTDCRLEHDFADTFRPEPHSPGPRDWEAFKSTFRRTHNPAASPQRADDATPAPPEAPTTLQNLAGEASELPSYEQTMQQLRSPPSWRAQQLERTSYRIGDASVLAGARNGALKAGTSALLRRLRRLGRELAPGTPARETVAHIRASLRQLRASAEADLSRARRLERRMVGAVRGVGFLVDLEAQAGFARADRVCKALFMRMLDDSSAEPRVVARRFGAWVARVEEAGGEFRGKKKEKEEEAAEEASAPTETTPLISPRRRGSLVEVVVFDVGDLCCVVFGAASWFAFLFLLWLTLG